ncbi:MAG: hypothetical protein LBD46_07640 [Endomicrobium sp.]|jgi:hypothetical protein|nr:hypothetical protein [Endomicrobium sp.]
MILQIKSEDFNINDLNTFFGFSVYGAIEKIILANRAALQVPLPHITGETDDQRRNYQNS